MPGPSDIDLFVDASGFFLWNDSLALFLCNEAIDPSSSLRRNPRDGTFEIYLMDNCCGLEGVKGARSWTRSVCIVMTPQTGIYDAFTLWKNDELLMVDLNAQLVSYNLRSKMLRNIHGARRPQNWVCCSYVKSLVSIRGR